MEILKELDVNKARGSDLIENRILKECFNVLAPPLNLLFNNSLDHSLFPVEWKKADVCHIFKKDDLQISSNYRPIFLLPSTSKILERIVYNRLYEYCVSNNLLTKKNSGFKKSDSTTNQLIHLTNEIYNGLDDGRKIAAVFLDITKAFDRVWHDGLIFKLEKIGIRGKLLNWFRSYLSGRSQRVFINGKCSAFIDISSGVPQGSILGPLLFLIFFNDIVNDIDNGIYLFADDTSLVGMGGSWDNVEISINSDLKKLEMWSKNWLASFNASKTEYILISNRPLSNKSISLQLNDTILSKVHSHKHLGLVLNNAFTWTDHVDFICKRVSKRLGLLYKFKNYLNRFTLSKLYLCWIRPIIEYCSVCYDNLTLNDSNRLDRLQRRAAIMCTGALTRTETTKLFADLGWSPLSDRRKCSKLTLMYKIINRLTPDYLFDDYIKTQNFKTRRNLRSANRNAIPFCRTIKNKNSFFPSTLKSWNELDPGVINSPSLDKFKLALSSVNRAGSHQTAFNFLDGFYAKILTQIRLGLSSLHGQLFNYCLNENPICPLCLDKFESTEHFFLECPLLSVQRNLFMTALQKLVPNINSLNKFELLNLCLSGYENVNYEKDIEILRQTIIYLRNSGRFTSAFVTF